MLCFLEKEGKNGRLQINISSRNVFSMPLVEKSTLTVSPRFQMMTTTYVSEKKCHFFRRVCYGFYTGLNREPKSLLALFIRWVHMSCSVILFRHTLGSLNSVIQSVNEDYLYLVNSKSPLNSRDTPASLPTLHHVHKYLHHFFRSLLMKQGT